MAFSSNAAGGRMVDINVTPLVDVMLVLLIIFMVTAPMATYQIDIDLPQRTTNPPPQPLNPPEPIKLTIDAGGQVLWNGQSTPISLLEGMMQAETQLPEQPTLEIETHPDAEYSVLAEVLAAAKNSNMKKIGFVENM